MPSQLTLLQVLLLVVVIILVVVVMIIVVFVVVFIRPQRIDKINPKKKRLKRMIIFELLERVV